MDLNNNTFGRDGNKRGYGNINKRDYELTYEELKRRNRKRKFKKYKTKNENPYGILIWYDETLEELNSSLNKRELIREYILQRACAIRGYVARAKPSEHFLFDFDLEQMLKDNVYNPVYGKKVYITKWWKGEIRHWTVNDGVWKE